ncbi:MAG TPA: quinone oxidoreductase [Thermoanaerobaculia bacterium]|nr:quinone oxidoreductase [Thermoanaerobaculia bacterium]
MSTTPAVRVHQIGGPEVLSFEEIEVAEPGPQQVLIRQTAVGLNFIDTYHRSGLYPVELPATLGSEAAGVIEAVGDEVEGFVVGDRVAYVRGPGAYCGHRVMDASVVLRLPDPISEEQAAAILLKGMTVEYLLRRTYPVRAGETIVWHAAAGGVGLIACQWASHLGATVIGTVGSEEKAELARAHGCRHTILYREESVPDRVRELTGGAGVPVVYDSVGKDTFQDSLDCLQPRGMMVSFGNASGAVPPVAPGVLAQKGSLYLTRPSLFHYTATRDELEDCAGALFEVVGSGAVKVEVSHRYPLAEAERAHRDLESRATTGSVVLVP